MELELGGLEEIERWILSWGKHARVLAPMELVARIRDEARGIMKVYETVADGVDARLANISTRGFGDERP